MTIDASRDIGFAALSKCTAVPIATEFLNIGDPPEDPTRSADSPVVTFKATPADDGSAEVRVSPLEFPMATPAGTLQWEGGPYTLLTLRWGCRGSLIHLAHVHTTMASATIRLG